MIVHSKLISALKMSVELRYRPRRLRDNETLRSMTLETSLSIKDLVLPIFISDEISSPKEIESMPGVFCWPVSQIVDQVEKWIISGIRAFAVFPKIDPSKKTETGDECLNPNSVVYEVARSIKSNFSQISLIGDLALDPYTSHGHDGVLDEDGRVDNDRTVEILAKASVLAADAGYDVLAPSDMMDGRVGVIRSHLEKNGHIKTCIMSYAAKFCSSYYGPFRDAIGASNNVPIDKSGYQLSPNNFREATRELELDFEEGADILMIKPAEPFLDVIHYARNHFTIPIAAYQVSGEYSRITAAGLNGWLDAEKCAIESLTSIKRAGADLILTYFADKVASSI